MSNKTIIQKADLALQDLASNGGLLLPEQADRFIIDMIDQPTMLGRARVVTMNAPQRKVNKIGFGERIMRKAQSSVALTKEKRAKPTTAQIELNTKEVIAEIRLPYDVLEDNIEGGNINARAGEQAGGLMNTLIGMIGERAALDLEEWALLGDTASADEYLAMNDGWLKLCSAGNIDSFTLGQMDKSACKKAILALPTRFLRNKPSMSYFMSHANETELRDTYANRQTQLGDNNLQNANDISVFGCRAAPVALMPENRLLFTNPNNLLFGIQRKITMEYDKDITAREFIIVVTCRVDAQVEEVDATVLLNGVAPVQP